MTTAPEPGEEAVPAQELPCRMCEQCGHMIRTAENRSEWRLAQALTRVLTEHRARHHAQPHRLRLCLQPVRSEDEDGKGDEGG